MKLPLLIRAGSGGIPSPTEGNPTGTGSGGVITGGDGSGTGSTNTPAIDGTPIPTTAHLDGADCDKISGWAFANAGGNAKLDIYLTDPTSIGDRMIKAATIIANNNPRPDVQAAHGNNPNIPLDCGFVWTIPDAYKKGQRIKVKVVPANDLKPNADISNSPLITSGGCSKPATTPPGSTPGPPSFLYIGSPGYLAIAQFYAEMSSWGNNFTDEEKEVIAEFPDLMNSIRNYVNEHEQKTQGFSAFKLSSID